MVSINTRAELGATIHTHIPMFIGFGGEKLLTIDT